MATTPRTTITDLARRFRVDVDTATYPASLYQQILGIFDLKLIEELRSVDDETYDDAGAMKEAVTGYNWRLEGKIKWSTNVARTVVDPVHAFLRTKFAAARGSNVALGEFGVRWYDRDGLDDGHSVEGRAYVKVWSPDGGTPGNPSDVSITIQGQGPLTAITNPAASLIPTVTGLAPATGAAAGGNLVQIMGSNFSTVVGAAGVKFGANNATQYTIVHGGLIVAEAPAGIAGTVQVSVTNPSGTSVNTAADDYVYV
ncbi:MAG: IPT/TIG domain-containing protein [Hamadaea sp.]|nr:IPT/TIG domain-containing protein [Hamadaea sp.]